MMFGRYVKNFNKNLGETFDSEKAKKTRKKLLTFGIIGLILAIILIIVGFTKMFSGFGENDSCNIKDDDWFECEKRAGNRTMMNFISSFGIVAVGFVLLAISIGLIQASFAILVTGKSSKFIDKVITDTEIEEKRENPKETKKCKSCGAVITFHNGKWTCPYCGNDL